MKEVSYEKKIIKLIQEYFKDLDYRQCQELSSKKIYGIFVEDIFSLIDSVLEEDGASFKVNLDFIISEFLMDGNRYNSTQIMRRIIKALEYINGFMDFL